MDYKNLAEHLIDEKCDSFGIRETIFDLIQYGVDYDELIELKFDKDDIERAYEAADDAEVDDIINEAFAFTQDVRGDILESDEFKKELESHKKYVLKTFKPKNILEAPEEFERRQKNREYPGEPKDRESYFLEQCAKATRAKEEDARGLLDFSESITNSLGYKEEIENGRENRSE